MTFDYQLVIWFDWLGSAETKIDTYGAVKKVLELTETWKYPNFIGKF